MTPSESTPPTVASSRNSAHDHHGSGHLARSAGTIGAATLTSRLLGLARDQTLAYLFGASNAMDAFNVAYRIPNLMRDLFAEGVMSAAFVPTFTRRLTLQGKASAWHVGNQLVNALIIATGTLVVLGIIFAEPLARLLAGNYEQVPGKLELTIFLTRIMLPFLTLIAIAAAVMGMLNSLNKFLAPALSPAMFNVGIIASAVLLVPVMPRWGLHPITAIAIGAVIGGFGQILLQLPSLYREGYRYRPEFDPTDSGLREILGLIGPGTIAGAALQVNLLVNMVLATGEETGAVSWLGYAFRVMYLPIGLFGVSIATATLPAISRQAVQEDLPAFRKTVSNAMRMMLVLNIPALVGLMVLAEPIIGLIFQRGSFGPSDTTATTAALMFYAPGLVGYSTVRIAIPCFYAMRNSLTPTLVSVMSVALNISLNVILVRVLGFRGLALGTSIAALFNALVLVGLLHRRLHGVDLSRILKTGGKITVAAALMGAAVSISHSWLVDSLPEAGLLPRSFQVFGSVAIGVAVLAASARLLRISEWLDLERQLVTGRNRTP